jgi:hypothetical protein
MSTESPFASTLQDAPQPADAAAPACDTNQPCCPCVATRIVRSVGVLLVLGTAAAYGAAAAKPELARHMTFLPGMSCMAKSADASGGCCDSSCPASGCSQLSRAAIMAQCSELEKANEEKAKDENALTLAPDVFAAEPESK